MCQKLQWIPVEGLLCEVEKPPATSAQTKLRQFSTSAAVPFVVSSASVFCTGSACQLFFHFFFPLFSLSHFMKRSEQDPGTALEVVVPNRRMLEHSGRRTDLTLTICCRASSAMLSKGFATNVHVIGAGSTRPVVSRKTPSNGFPRADARLSSSANALTMFFLKEQHTRHTQPFVSDTRSSSLSQRGQQVCQHCTKK